MKLLAAMTIFSSVFCLPAMAAEAQQQNEDTSKFLSTITSLEGEEPQNLEEDEATALRGHPQAWKELFSSVRTK